MAHLITSSDRVYSNKGKEWHGKAWMPLGKDGLPVASLERHHISDILFPVLETASVSGVVDTPHGPQVVAFPHKGVVADLTHRGEGFVPLEMHTDKYSVIENSRIFEAVENFLTETPHSVTTAGTLDGCKRFFVSVQLAGDLAGINAGGDTFKSFLNFVSSHDGTLALQAYDSNTRIVCNNTLVWSLDDAGKLKVRIKHTAGADVQLLAAGDWLKRVLTGREAFAGAYQRAKNTAVSRHEALAGILGYVWSNAGKPEEMSTRARNQVDGIYSAFEAGKGNAGETMGDVLNGFTEYYTLGAGTGAPGQKAPSDFERMISANFGSQAGKKSDFADLILAPDRSRGAGLAWPDYVSAGQGKAGDAWKSGLERTRAASGSYGQRAAAPAPAVQPVTVEVDSAGLMQSVMAQPQAPKAGMSDLDLLLSGKPVPVL